MEFPRGIFHKPQVISKSGGNSITNAQACIPTPKYNFTFFPSAPESPPSRQHALPYYNTQETARVQKSHYAPSAHPSQRASQLESTHPCPSQHSPAKHKTPSLVCLYPPPWTSGHWYKNSRSR